MSQEYNFSLNNREKALVIIIFISLVLLGKNKKVRKSLFDVIKVMCNKHFIKIYIEIFLYSIIMVLILYKLKYWEFIYVKDTLLWIFFSAIYLSYKVADSNGEIKVFKDIFKETFGIFVIIDFLLNTYTFSLIVEVILLVVLLFLGLMIGFIEVSPDTDGYDQVHKLFTWIDIYIGINILLYIVIKVLGNMKSLLTTSTLKSFLLPIILTLIFLPYLFYLRTRLSYERLKIFIKMNKISSKKTIWYFKIKMYLNCRFDEEKIANLERNKRHLIMNMKTKKDVDNIFV